jgi:hypothetical protein
MRKCEPDRRASERTKLRGHTELRWQDSTGVWRKVKANSCDVSDSGMLVESPCPIPEGASVEISPRWNDLPETLTVRYCREYGGWYRLGLGPPYGEDDEELSEEANIHGIHLLKKIEPSHEVAPELSGIDAVDPSDCAPGI